MIQLQAVIVGVLLLMGGGAFAEQPVFERGPLIEEYGPAAIIPGAAPLPADVKFNVAFDVTERGEIGGVNRRLETAARFLNMHAKAGVRGDQINLAVVVHGPAVNDLTHDAAYGEKNANADLIKALQLRGVKVYVCGQSAAYQNVAAADLLPGVEMAVSAMTAHALLQQKGYTLNPF